MPLSLKYLAELVETGNQGGFLPLRSPSTWSRTKGSSRHQKFPECFEFRDYLSQSYRSASPDSVLMKHCSSYKRHDTGQ